MGKIKGTGKYKYYIILALAVLVAICFLGKLTSGGQKPGWKLFGWEKTKEGWKKQKSQGKEKKLRPKDDGGEEGALGNPMIRVVLKTDGFVNVAHPEVCVTADGGMSVSGGGEVLQTAPGEQVVFAPDDARFGDGTIVLEPLEQGGRLTVLSMNRGYGNPVYRGKLELFSTAEGIVIVNELPMEQYLYGVVPSEMPASYEPEALKVQAVCARSYASVQTKGLNYPEYSAHIDDSTAFQVYGNSAEQERANAAVDATCGEKLWHDGEVITAYYFSTSAGRTTDIEAWGSRPEEKGYLQSVAVCDGARDYESQLPWYRWNARIPADVLGNLICLNTQTDIGALQSLEVTKYGAGGVALELEAVGDMGRVTVNTENKIRRALGGAGYTITKQDGTVVESMTLLPSAFFTVSCEDGSYVIDGGGFGHGIGMSQNGANEMAKKGKNYKEILSFFYRGIEITEKMW